MHPAVSFDIRGPEEAPRGLLHVARPLPRARGRRRSPGPAGTTTRFPDSRFSALGLGVAFALGIIALELRAYRVPAHQMVGALVGGVTGLLGANLVWGVLAGLQLGARAVHPLPADRVPDLHGRRDRRAPRRVVRAGAPDRGLQGRVAAAPVQGARHLGDHRRPHRRHLRDRLPRRHARRAAVRAARAAAGRRLLRLAQAQPRPARARHPAARPEDGARPGADRRDRLPRGARGRPEADRARQAAQRQDRHERLQPQQGRAAARRRGAQHQRARQLAQAGGAAGRGAARLRAEGRQGGRARASPISTTARWWWSTRASARSAARSR